MGGFYWGICYNHHLRIFGELDFEFFGDEDAITILGFAGWGIILTRITHQTILKSFDDGILNDCKSLTKTIT